jgi:NTE family protein
LGVGAGYGFCHIGVLKVIEEEKIPIDVITGSSIGAIIASLWVTGRSASEILEITREFKKQNFVWKLVDFTFPSIGFIKGNRLYAFLKKYLGTKTFRDVSLPLKVIASDIKRKEPRVLDKGLLVDALMASCAMPGIFRPFKFRDDILFDGGVTNPLPTEELYRMGMKKIIAVNVTPSRQDIIRQYEELKTHLAPGPAHKKREWFSLRRYFQQRLKNNILEIIFSSIELMQSELVEKEAELADVLLHPDTSGLHWMEFHRAEEFASRGEQEARRQIEKIKQLVND